MVWELKSGRNKVVDRSEQVCQNQWDCCLEIGIDINIQKKDDDFRVKALHSQRFVLVISAKKVTLKVDLWLKEYENRVTA